MGWLLTLKRRFKVEELTRDIYRLFAEARDVRQENPTVHPPHFSCSSRGHAVLQQKQSTESTSITSFLRRITKAAVEGLAIDDELVNRLELDAIS